MIEYYCFLCRNCGRWSSMEIRKDVTKSVFHCRYCNKTSQLKQKNTWGLANDSRGPFNHPTQAQSTVNRLNAQR